MAIPSSLNPFPNPVESQTPGVMAFMARGNDNLIAQKINAILTYLPTLSPSSMTSNNTYWAGTATALNVGLATTIFSPASGIVNYICFIGGVDGTAANAFLDIVMFFGNPGWAPVVASTNNTLGAPGARTYTNAVGNLQCAVAGVPLYSVTTAYIRLG